MRLLIHDINKEEFKEIFSELNKDIKVIEDNNKIKNCIGCFGCWVKTPGRCVIKDEYSDMGKLIANSQEVIIISKCVYGSYSPFIKNVLDRSISYIHPYFEVRNGEFHHRSRYKEKIDLSVYFYSKDIMEEEKKVAIELVKANGINLNTKKASIYFVKELLELKGIIK